MVSVGTPLLNFVRSEIAVGFFTLYKKAKQTKTMCESRRVLENSFIKVSHE